MQNGDSSFMLNCLIKYIHDSLVIDVTTHYYVEW